MGVGGLKVLGCVLLRLRRTIGSCSGRTRRLYPRRSEDLRPMFEGKAALQDDTDVARPNNSTPAIATATQGHFSEATSTERHPPPS